jgi:neurotrimin
MGQSSSNIVLTGSLLFSRNNYMDSLIFNVISGKPMPSTFKIHTSSTPTTQNLFWQTESLSPISEYSLKFIQIKTGTLDFKNPRNMIWKEIIIPAEFSEGPIHTKGYLLQGLVPGSVYEVIIFSRNRYGWSEPSKILKFFTPSEGKLVLIQ